MIYKILGFTFAFLGLLAIVLMIIFSWDITIQIYKLQVRALQSYWYLFLTMFVAPVIAIILFAQGDS